MSEASMTFSYAVEQSPQAVFAAIADVRGWWIGEIEGTTDAAGAEFTYRYKDIHRSAFRIAAFEPAKRIVWHVTDTELNFVDDKDEWVGTDVVFEIAPKNGGAELTFTHVGLVPSCQCYQGCFRGWSHYINTSLRELITKGEGKPFPKAS